MDGNPDVWEGLCGSCNEWIALVSSKKKGTTWFRHAYKCHTHPKIKDAPKRRRESNHTRLAASTMAKPKTEPQAPLTPQMTPGPLSAANTPTLVVQQQQQQQQQPQILIQEPPPPLPQAQQRHHYTHAPPQPQPQMMALETTRPPPPPLQGKHMTAIEGLGNMI